MASYKSDTRPGRKLIVFVLTLAMMFNFVAPAFSISARAAGNGIRVMGLSTVVDSVDTSGTQTHTELVSYDGETLSSGAADDFDYTAATFVGGYIIAVDEDGAFYAIDKDDLSKRTYINTVDGGQFFDLAYSPYFDSDDVLGGAYKNCIFGLFYLEIPGMPGSYTTALVAINYLTGENVNPENPDYVLGIVGLNKEDQESSINFYNLACDEEGNFYGTGVAYGEDGSAASNSKLYKFRLEDEATTYKNYFLVDEVGNIGYSYFDLHSLEYDAVSDKLYMSQYNYYEDGDLSGDVNSDGKTDAEDAQAILDHCAGKTVDNYNESTANALSLELTGQETANSLTAHMLLSLVDNKVSSVYQVSNLLTVDPETAKADAVATLPGQTNVLFVVDDNAEKLDATTPQKILVTPSSLELVEGETAKLTARLLPWNATGSVYWSSKNPAVAQINENTGEVTAIAAGQTTITVNGPSGLSVDVPVTIKPAIPDVPTMNAIMYDKDGKGHWVQFSADSDGDGKIDVEKLGDLPDGVTFSSAAVVNGYGTGEESYPGERLYAVTEEKSDVYVINTETWTATKFNENTSAYNYKDIARADNLDVKTPRSFLAVAGNKLVQRTVYTSNFGESATLDYSATDLVGITYLRSDIAGYSYRYDEFAILDANGNLYHDAFTESYDEHPLMAVAGQKYTYVSSGIHINSQGYNSIYNDGEYIYWARCKADGNYDLDMFDLTRGTYKNVGSFPEGVKITGLFRLGMKEGQVAAASADGDERTAATVQYTAPVLTPTTVLPSTQADTAGESDVARLPLKVKQATNGKFVVTYKPDEVTFSAESDLSTTYAGRVGIYDDGEGTVTVTYAGGEVLSGEIALLFKPTDTATETVTFTVKTVEDDASIATAENPLATAEETVTFGNDVDPNSFPVRVEKANLVDQSGTVKSDLTSSYEISGATNGVDCTEYTVTAKDLRYHKSDADWGYWMGVTLTGDETEFTYKYAGTREGLKDAVSSESSNTVSIYTSLDGKKSATKNLWLEVTTTEDLSKTYHITFKAEKKPVTVTIVAPYSTVDESAQDETVRTIEVYPERGTGEKIAMLSFTNPHTILTIPWLDAEPYTLKAGFVTESANAVSLFNDATLTQDTAQRAYVYTTTVDATLNLNIAKGNSITVNPNTPGVEGNKTVTYWFRPSSSTINVQLPLDPTNLESNPGNSATYGANWVAAAWKAPEGQRFKNWEIVEGGTQPEASGAYLQYRNLSHGTEIRAVWEDIPIGPTQVALHMEDTSGHFEDSELYSYPEVKSEQTSDSKSTAYTNWTLKASYLKYHENTAAAAATGHTYPWSYWIGARITHPDGLPEGATLEYRTVTYNDTYKEITVPGEDEPWTTDDDGVLDLYEDLDLYNLIYMDDSADLWLQVRWNGKTTEILHITLTGEGISSNIKTTFKWGDSYENSATKTKTFTYSDYPHYDNAYYTKDWPTLNEDTHTLTINGQTYEIPEGYEFIGWRDTKTDELVTEVEPPVTADGITYELQLKAPIMPSTVTAAPLADASGNYTDVGTVSVENTTGDKEYAEYTVTANNLRYHQKGSDWGYWLGASFSAPEGLTAEKLEYRTSDSNTWTGEWTTAENNKLDYYTTMTTTSTVGVADAEDDLWVQVKWNGGAAETIHIIFKASRTSVDLTYKDSDGSPITTVNYYPNVSDFKVKPSQPAPGGKVITFDNGETYTLPGEYSLKTWRDEEGNPHLSAIKLTLNMSLTMELQLAGYVQVILHPGEIASDLNPDRYWLAPLAIPLELPADDEEIAQNSKTEWTIPENLSFDYWTDGSGSRVDGPISLKANETYEFTAHWKAMHTITFMHGDEYITELKVPHGERVAEVPQPSSREGYRFNGWWTRPADGSESVQLTTDLVINSDMTFYANWEKAYTITFLPGDGATGDKLVQSGYFEETLENLLLTVSTEKWSHEGYTFVGWVKEGTTEPVYTDSISTELLENGELTLVAVWTKDVVPTDPSDPTNPTDPTEPDDPVEPHDCPSKHFTDVDITKWYHEAIDFVVENKLMFGIGSNLFDPEGPTTRGQLVAILYRLEGSPAYKGNNEYTDVPASHRFANAIAWGTANKIIYGYGNGIFGVDDSITREQFATILYRFAQYKGYDLSNLADLSGYSDADQIGRCYRTGMRWANACGFILGRSKTQLVPQGNAKRAEAARILMELSAYCEEMDQLAKN